MYTTWKLTIASIKMFVRNRQAIFFTFFTPLLIMVIFGSIGFDNPPTINVGIALSGSINQPTQEFLGELRQVPVFKLSYGSLDEEKGALQAGNRSLVIDLTHNPFGSETGVGTLSVYSKAGDSQAGTAISILNQFLDKMTIAASHAPQLVNLAVTEINSHNLKYIDFLLPGLVALSVMQLSVFSVAFVFVDYKEKGILKRILATPLKPYQFVTANIITRLIMSVVQAGVFITIGVVFFHAHIVGSYFAVLLIVLLGAIMFLGLGFTISGLASTTESVPALANLIVFPMIFLGGTFFSIDSMPHWLQIISKILPLTYFSTALRNVTNNGYSIDGNVYNIIAMLIWAVILIFLAIRTFRFEEKRA